MFRQNRNLQSRKGRKGSNWPRKQHELRAAVSEERTSERCVGAELQGLLISGLRGGEHISKEPVVGEHEELTGDKGRMRTACKCWARLECAYGGRVSPGGAQIKI